MAIWRGPETYSAPIRYKFGSEKAKALIHKAILDNQGIDLHSLLMACYFAEKQHLNDYGRPIFGATYRAMTIGPVAIEVYEMLNHEPIWLAETKTQHRFPWYFDGYHLHAEEGEIDFDVTSKSDIRALNEGLSKALSLNLTAATIETHGLDWQKANLGIINYADMIEESPNRDNMIEELITTSRFTRL